MPRLAHCRSLGLLIVDPEGACNLNEHPDRFGFPEHHPPMTSFLGVPIAVRGRVFGNLYLCDKVGGEVFTDVDAELAVGLASSASPSRTPTSMPGSPSSPPWKTERIARDLHDTIQIQRLFAVGFGLQATMRMVSDRVVSDRLTAVVDDLRRTVRDVRAAIFELHMSRLPGSSVRQQLIELSTEGAQPRVRSGGAFQQPDQHHGDRVARRRVVRRRPTRR